MPRLQKGPLAQDMEIGGERPQARQGPSERDKITEVRGSQAHGSSAVCVVCCLAPGPRGQGLNLPLCWGLLPPPAQGQMRAQRLQAQTCVPAGARVAVCERDKGLTSPQLGPPRTDRACRTASPTIHEMTSAEAGARGGHENTAPGESAPMLGGLGLPWGIVWELESSLSRSCAERRQPVWETLLVTYTASVLFLPW